MEIKKFNIDGHEFIFVCTSRNTRDGFAHDCTMDIENRQFKATCFYLNRTWEKYRYQSVMLKAVENARKYRFDTILNAFKTDNGYSKLTAKRREAFEDIVKRDNYMNVLTDLKNALK